MAEELKHVLSYYKEEKQKKKLDILHTPDIFIDQRSTVREVQSWLKAKQFSSRVIKYLEGMNGRQVLGMHREALEAAFGNTAFLCVDDMPSINFCAASLVIFLSAKAV